MLTDIAVRPETSTSTSRGRPLVSLVLPAFNESGILERNLETLVAHLRAQEARYRWEIVVVNDGSTDATGAVAEAFAARTPGVRVVHHVANMNLGQALRTGFANSRGDYVVVLDVDLSYEPAHVDQLVQTLEATGADIVVASPYMPGGKVSAVPPLRLFLSRWANRFLAYFAYQAQLHTITGMVRGYRREFLLGLDLRAIGVDINSEIIYKAMMLRGRILEIPAHLDWSLQRQHGVARLSSFRIYRGILSYLLAGFFFRPFMFFILPGLALMLVTLYIMGWIAVNLGDVYATIPPMPDRAWDARFSAAVAQTFRERPHAFLVGGVTLLLSIQLQSLGILALQSKRYFEELFHLSSSVRRNTLRQPDDER